MCYTYLEDLAVSLFLGDLLFELSQCLRRYGGRV